MQRRSTTLQQNNVSQYHFAVSPYQVEYTTPNDQIYSVYFQKGLQILGSTQYPIQNHQKLKTLQLPIEQNLIQFRLFSDKNSQYQWSIYKRIDQMEEFLESKKVNLKDYLKKSTQFKSQQKIQPNDSKNGTYTSSTTFDQAKFILKFYIFKAASYAQLTKLVEEKVGSKNGDRAPLSEISSNKIKSKNSMSKPKSQQNVSVNQNQIQAPKQLQNNSTPVPPNKYQLTDAQANQQLVETVTPSVVVQQLPINQQKQKIVEQVQIKEQVKKQEKLPSVTKKQSVFSSKKQSVFNSKKSSKKQQPFSSSLKQTLMKQQTPQQQKTQQIQYPQIQTQQPVIQTNQQPVQTLVQGQGPVVSQQQQRLADQNVQIVVPPEASKDNRKFGVILLLILIIYLASFLNLKQLIPVQENKIQGIKKGKIPNRNKFKKA